MLVCLYAPDLGDAEEELGAELLQVSPRVAVGKQAVWLDARGLDAGEVARRALAQARALGVVEARAAISDVPIVAELSARAAGVGECIEAPPDARAAIAHHPLSWLGIDDGRVELLEGVGVRTCGELAALDRESIEIRFGAELVRAWRLARADDDRRLFAPLPRERPHATLEFIDYVVTDPERLLFSANALFGTICERLHAHGEHARRIELSLSLANGETWRRTLKPARPTANRAVWLRLSRALLEKLTVPDAVTGIALCVDAVEPASAVQGDLFDVGFATVSAVDEAVARLIETQEGVIAEADSTLHALIEERNRFIESSLENRTERKNTAQTNPGDAAAGALTLQLLPVPREVLVETIDRRDHVVPIRYRDGQWRQLVTAAGPDRISGGRWAGGYAREYYRAVTVDGLLVWLFRDARTDTWFLHGWWD